jgi:hypothetical protein
MTYPILGVVVGIVYPDEEESQHKCGVEYEIRPLLNGLPHLKNVPVAQGFNYYGDGTEEILKVASKPADPSGTAFGSDGKLPPQRSDGDVVVIAFIQAMWTRPVIIGRWAHDRNPVRAKNPAKAATEIKQKNFTKGKTARTTITNGTKVMVDESGNVSIILGKHTDDDAVSDKKKLTVLKSDGTTPVFCINNTGGSWKIDFGAPDGEPLPLGGKLKTFLGKMITAWSEHTHDISGLKDSGTSGGSVTGTLGAADKVEDPDDWLSDWIKSTKVAP